MSRFGPLGQHIEQLTHPHTHNCSARAGSSKEAKRPYQTGCACGDGVAQHVLIHNPAKTQTRGDPLPANGLQSTPPIRTQCTKNPGSRIHAVYHRIIRYGTYTRYAAEMEQTSSASRRHPSKLHSILLGSLRPSSE